ncbi:MAG: N,N-dimethylformamidase beta subunit family domain-containing protein, partial [Verrucomicrobiia bacterium]
MALFALGLLPTWAQNPIVLENQQTGNPSSDWDISGAGDLSIQGFATDISVNKGQTVRFKIKTDASLYQIDIYRLGFYQGNGARKVGTGVITAALPQTQPADTYDATTGLTDCGNWAESAHWDVPANAVSGIYIAKLTRPDTSGASHMVFIVRDDTNRSGLFFQTSDATWQAYNVYGSNSLYVGITSFPGGHAAKVSYNRPFLTRAGGGGGGAAEDWLFNSEYPMVRWLEANGYDMTYTTDVDSDRRGSLITNHTVFMSVGHDEYWSAAQRANVLAARDAGVHLAFFGGNDIYWKTRWEPSPQSGDDYRTLVCYKEGTLGENSCGGKCDPLPAVWTGLWRDGCSFSPPADGCAPENALSGQISWDGTAGTIQVPDTYKNLRFWRNTAVASLGPGQTATLAANTLGYEWDWQQYDTFYPPGRILLSSTTLDGRIHHLSLYRHSSGALVFGAGTVQWSWGLDGNHDRGGSTPDPSMQQATVNLLADMGAQPATLQPGLVAATASTDFTAPISVINFPPNNGSIASGSAINISGTATDVGGIVAGVEVSLDGGTTWNVAAGTTNWVYAWTPAAQGTVTIESRAFDDSGNLEVPGGGEAAANIVTVTVTAPPTRYTVFQPTDAPSTGAGDNAVELGMKFRASVAGYITGVRFYKGNLDGGSHLGHLWSSSGTMLAEATFTGETASGWQEVSFASPVAIAANTTYIVSYHSSVYYEYTQSYFTQAVTNGPLWALADGEDGPNGVYAYSAGPVFPNSSGSGQANYWVDVVFNTSGSLDVTPPIVTAVSPADGATAVSIFSSVTGTFSEAINPLTVNNSTFVLVDPANNVVPASMTYNPGTLTATVTPSAALAYATTYTATLKGGGTDPRIEDPATNALASDFVWSFTTGAPPPPPPNEGPGGPILVISTTSNPFSRYFAEILRAEGLNEYTAMDVSLVTPAVLSSYDAVILGDMPLSAAQVTMFSDWVNAGGNLIAMRPDKQLAGLLGLTDAAATLPNAYLRVYGTGAGAGIVTNSIQFHGIADGYTLNGATALASLLSNATNDTLQPAVTVRSVGSNGGHAAAFTFDLARSIVYTRQGNPAWAGQKRDGQIEPIRSDDMFFGNASYDPEPDWVDLNKVAIPQADEQQRLLANLLGQMNLARKPLPRFWYLPRGLKAAVVMTGDDHANGGTVGRFQTYEADSPTNGSVDNWECIRSSSYIYPGTPITDAQAAAFAAEGFEIGTHVFTGCADWTPDGLAADFTDQQAQLAAQLPSLAPAVTQRTHCIAWSDWATQPKVELTNGIRLDATYYYWPATWVQNRPGFFTGSGMPMRFADLDGTIIDVYQAVTQMTDESGQSYPYTVNSLLDGALGSQGYYGVFTANMHTDYAASSGSDAIVASAQARGVPVVSGRQMLTWLDGRNGSSFGSLNWNNNTLSFTVAVGPGANGLQAMVPTTSAVGPLASITSGASSVTYSNQTIKGVEYAFFPASNGTYQVTYTPDTTPPVITGVVATAGLGGVATITWTTDEPSDSQVEYGTAPNSLTLTASDETLVATHSLTLTGLATSTTYYFRVTSADAENNSAASPASPAPPDNFTTPTVAFLDTTVADFSAGTPGANTYISQTTDGEVILNPAFGDEFPGTALSAGWSGNIWNAGGSLAVGGGSLTVNGAHAASTASFGPGSSMEFVATFQAGPFQHVGFSSDIAFDAPWVAFGTSAAGNGVYARSSGSSDILISASLLGTPHRYRIVWNPGSFDFYVDGVQVATISVGIASSMLAQISDDNIDAASLQVDWLRVAPYAASGTFVSRVFDAGAAANWDALAWTRETPPGTTLALGYRIGDTPTPDSSWTAFTPVSSSGAALAGNARYFQYEAQLATSDPSQTPVLDDVTISYDLKPDTTAPTITSQSPAPGVMDISTNTGVVVFFSEPMNPATITTASLRLRRVGDSTDVAATVSSPGATAILTPNNPLIPGVSYQVTVAGTVTDLNGNPLGADGVWTFSTTPSTTNQTDTTVADFSAGTVADCSAVVSQIGDGEVILAPTINEDFSATTLPADWASDIWPGGGSVTVGGGEITVNGAHAATMASLGPGSSMEFVATFQAGPYQNVGFASDFALDSPWVTFGTSPAGDGVYAMASDGPPIPISASLLGTPHLYRIVWNPGGFVYYVDGVSVATNNFVVGGNMLAQISDYTADAASLQVDWLRMSPYATPCTFTSRVIDAGRTVTWNTLAWSALTPAGTTLAMSYRTGDTPTPDGSWTAFTPVGTSGGALAGSSEYIQYAAQLATSDTTQTPVLEDVTVTYILCSPPVISGNPSSATRCAGDAVTFSVTTTDPGLTYQWRKGGVNIAGATGSSYTIAAVGIGDAGSYDVLVSGACGLPADASPATLTVNPLPTITLGSNPSVAYGSATANLSYTATGNGASQYAIIFDAAAHAAGFADVALTALPATPIAITLPGQVAAGAYHGTLIVHSASTGCTGGGLAFTIAVNPLPVQLTGHRPYDGTPTAPAGILSVANPVGIDVVTVSGTSGTLAGKDVGSENIASFSGLSLSGAQSANYTLTGASGSVTITVASLTVRAEDASRGYGETNPVFAVSYNGFVNNEGSGVLGGTL